MRVLFVCLGNICRSPAAEGVFRGMSSCSVDSAGTAGWHAGKPPYGPMQDAARSRGLDISDLRARQFTASDFAHFDLIVAMDDENVADIEALRPSGNEVPVRLFTDYGKTTRKNGVPDPYYTREFDAALDLIEDCALGLKAEVG